MGLEGKAHNTERAYVKWARRFMHEYRLTCPADFERVGDRERENFLTDLTFDGNVAPSTQDQAFYGLMRVPVFQSSCSRGRGVEAKKVCLEQHMEELKAGTFRGRKHFGAGRFGVGRLGDMKIWGQEDLGDRKI